VSARLLVGDVRAALATLPDASVDLVVTSPPFLALRSYLPPDHPDKALEIGSEATPGEFIDTLLDVVGACARVLAPHGSIAFELGDTYAGSGGAGGDYNEGGLRDGQPKFSANWQRADRGSGKTRRTEDDFPIRDDNPRPNRSGRMRDRRADEADGIIPAANGWKAPRPGWPLDKSACLIPQLFAIALSYGLNPITGRATDRWRVRNFVTWARPNPSVGEDYDKFRTACSWITVATMAKDRYWDGFAVRRPSKNITPPRDNRGGHRNNVPGRKPQVCNPVDANGRRVLESVPGTAPLYDYWMFDGYGSHKGDTLDSDLFELNTQGYPGSHYATWPEAIVVPLVLSMCPERVCRTCGKPSRRVVEQATATGVSLRDHKLDGTANRKGAAPRLGGSRPDRVLSESWTDCGHGSWRPGLVLDPFAGSGTTLQVATRLGRDAIGIDLDARNEDLVRQRVGLFMGEVVHLVSTRPRRLSVPTDISWTDETWNGEAEAYLR
jgi:hypothetical protein